MFKNKNSRELQLLIQKVLPAFYPRDSSIFLASTTVQGCIMIMKKKIVNKNWTGGVLELNHDASRSS